MLDYQVKVERIYFEKGTMRIALSGHASCHLTDTDYVPKAKLVLFFWRPDEDRRIPFVFSECEKRDGVFYFSGEYTYLLQHIFWKTKNINEETKLTFHLFCGTECQENIQLDMSEAVLTDKHSYYEYRVGENCLYLKMKDRYAKPQPAWRRALQILVGCLRMLLAIILIPWYVFEALLSFAGFIQLDDSIKNPKRIRRLIGHVNYRMKMIGGHKISVKALRKAYFTYYYSREKKREVIPNRITFLSQRRDELSGNFAFVYEQLKDVPGIDIKFWYNNKTPQEMNRDEIREFSRICAESKTIVLDEYTPQIHYFPLKPEISVIQLWHACGAFKTFGFTRLAKPMGSPQMTKMHRNYDAVTVSSTYCTSCHSEGFGISTDCIKPTGIPRTDVFFDETYKTKMQENFYEEHPTWKDKKIIMFAPTFRGMTREEAFYPMERFCVADVLDALGEEYAMIIKHHPFVTKKQPVPEAYQDRVLDMSDSTELNDLMFVCDLIITDYSSLIFEASLLKIPMLFYVFDLEEYIEERDFYFDLKLMSPGKLVYTQQELIDAVKNQDYGLDRMEEFTELFFDNPDGKASERVAKLILQTVEREE